MYSASGRGKEAEAAFAKALVLREKLATDHPTVPLYQRALACSHVNLGHLIRDAKRPADALTHQRRAIELLATVLAKEPRNPTARLYLRSAHWGEAAALGDLNRHAEAIVA